MEGEDIQRNIEYLRRRRHFTLFREGGGGGGYYKLYVKNAKVLHALLLPIYVPCVTYPLETKGRVGIWEEELAPLHAIVPQAGKRTSSGMPAFTQNFLLLSTREEKTRKRKQVFAVRREAGPGSPSEGRTQSLHTFLQTCTHHILPTIYPSNPFFPSLDLRL